MNTRRLLAATLVFCTSVASLSAQQPPDPQPPQDGPMMGISMTGPDVPNADPRLRPGAHVVMPMEGSPAEAAGLQSGDVIVKIDGKDIDGIKKVQSLIPTYSIGDTIEVTYLRGEQTLTAKLKLASRAAIQAAEKKRFELVGLPRPTLQVSEWINGPVDPAQLQGKVVVIHFFEMLCAGSLGYSLPRVAAWAKKHAENPAFALVGIHSTWEMPESQTPEKIKEFVARREYKYPIGIDQLRERPPVVPATMWEYRVANEEGRLGTPGTVIVDKQGIVRFKKYGNFDDKEAEKLLESLLAEPAGGGEPGK